MSLAAADARRIGAAGRAALTDDRRAEATATVIGLLEGVLGGALGTGDGARIAGYVAVRHELDLNGLHGRALDRGWALHLPRVTGEHSMGFSPWRPGDALVPNRWGIGEPTTEPAGAEDLDVVLLPCVAVDRRGTRVGHGAGFYDRALAGVVGDPRPALVGVAFATQLVEEIERRSWDVPLDLVVTEAGVITPA